MYTYIHTYKHTYIRECSLIQRLFDTLSFQNCLLISYELLHGKIEVIYIYVCMYALILEIYQTRFLRKVQHEVMYVCMYVCTNNLLLRISAAPPRPDRSKISRHVAALHTSFSYIHTYIHSFIHTYSHHL